MSSFTEKQKKDVKQTAKRRVIKAAANRRTQQNRINRGNWSRDMKNSWGKVEIPFPVLVKMGGI